MDEPTTALDVVMQRQIVEQIMALKNDLGFSVIFITHDVSLLLELADRIAIMYAGGIVEDASAGIDVAVAGLFQKNAKEEGMRLGIEYVNTGDVIAACGLAGAPC